MILNRFFKPKWQHADPQVRKQALQELSSADPILVQVARQDRSPEVRRTALERLTELPLLQQIARQDTDAEVRQAAEARCRELLAGTASGSPPLAIRLTALPELPADLVEFLALHGKEPELRLAALEQVEEEPLLERIVTDDPAANVRLAALERILTAPTLERIVKQSRSRDKGVYRRAQDRLDTSRAEQRRASRIQQLYVELEQLHWDGETGPQAARFPRLEKEWQELAAAADPGLRERYARARAQFLAERQTSVARRTARLEICANLERFLGTLQHEHELTPGLELALQETLQTTQSEWDHCGTVEDIEERRLEQRFLEVTRLLKEQERSLRRNHERALRLRTVLQQANALLNQPSEVLETDLKTLQQQWTGLERPETRELATQLQTEFDILLNKLRARLQRQVEHRDREWQELQELINALEKALEEGELQRAIELNNLARQRLQENIGLSRKQMTAVEERLHACTPHLNELRGWRRWGTNQAREHLCEQAESLSGLAADPPELARQIKELRTTWKTLDSVEGAASRALWKRFDGACERAYKPCQVYFEAQNHERQRHLAKKLALCERLERLLADTHWEQADWQWVDRSWREIQKEWHKVGPVNRADQKSLEHRFNAALQHVDKQLRVERERELQRRQALIERVQQLAASTDLQAAVEGAKQAQAEWHPTVQSGRREEQTLWRQFRAACDAVFTRRQAMQQAADVERQTNLARKTALCEEIEALATVDGEAIRQARKRFQEIQAEWPDIGPVPKTAVKAIEQRFLAAGDQLQRHSQALRQAGIRQELWSLRERARLCSRLEALLATAVPAEVETRLAEARQAWEQLPALQTTLAEPMQRRFETVCQALTTGDEARQALWRALEANLHKKQILCLRLEIAAGVESPLEFAQARMEYQVARLAESLSNRETAKSEDVREEVRKIQEAWCLLGVLPAAQQELLEQRFERALTALA